MNDLISRQAAISRAVTIPMFGRDIRMIAVSELEGLPSAKSKRDIPMKPMENTDRTWGILKRQAVCPRCGYYLPRVYFLEEGTSKSKCRKITYCDTCGQAIDWEGWEDDG